ncbi:MAG TPA: ATP-binding protein [Candidatus Obscuribacterales bacterium]
MVQVMVNLLSNAIKFSPNNSTVRVEIEQIDRFTEVRVRDCGTGMSPLQMKDVFSGVIMERRSGQVRSRLGLGLAICRAIIEEHEGSIDVESQEGVGSTFWFRIPNRDVLD